MASKQPSPQPEAERLTQEQLDRVVDRARKILAQARDGSVTEDEADTAMRRVQELMAKYNLDLASIEAAGGNAGARAQEEIIGKTRFHWQRETAKYVAEAHFCYHLIGRVSVGGHWKRRGTGEAVATDEAGRPIDRRDSDIWVERKRVNQHIFVGRHGNVKTAVMMYHYITQTIENLTPIQDNKDRLSRFAMSFKAGCAERVCARLSKRRADLIASHDAKVKAEQQAAIEALERQRAEKAARRALPAHQPSETQAAFAAVTADARQGRSTTSQAQPPEHPPLDPNGPWTPAANSIEDDEPEVPPVALVLMSEYDESEVDANIEFLRGLPPGTLAKERAAEAQWEREWEERQAACRAQAALEEVERPIVEETERERKARERREEREYEADRRRWAREDAAEERRAMKEYYKYDRGAFDLGKRAGNKIGLDPQVGARSGGPTKLLRGR